MIPDNLQVHALQFKQNIAATVSRYFLSFCVEPNCVNEWFSKQILDEKSYPDRWYSISNASQYKTFHKHIIDMIE